MKPIVKIAIVTSLGAWLGGCAALGAVPVVGPDLCSIGLCGNSFVQAAPPSGGNAVAFHHRAAHKHNKASVSRVNQ